MVGSSGVKGSRNKSKMAPTQKMAGEAAAVAVGWRGVTAGSSLTCSNSSSNSGGGGARLLLLTLRSTSRFYERHDFVVIDDPKAAEASLPPLLLFEYLAGSVVARLSQGPGSELMMMEWRGGRDMVG